MPQLEIQLLANLTRYTADMAKAQQTAEKTFSGINKSAGALGPILAGIGAGLSFDALKRQFDDTVSHMAKLDDAAEQTGASVEKLSGIFYALKPSGATLDQITDAATKLVKGMQGADEETKGAGLAFQKLGIQTRDANGNLRDSGEVMVQLAKKLGEYADGSNKTAIAQAIFGKTGASLLPILKDLGEAGELNVKVTAEQAAAAEAYEKEIKKLSRASDELKISIANSLIPTLTDLIRQFNQARADGLGFLDALGTIAGGSSSSKFQQFESANKTLETLEKNLDRLKNSGERVFNKDAAIESTTAALEKQRKVVEALRIQSGATAERNLRSNALYDADIAKPQAPAIPKQSTGGGSSGKTDFEKEREKILERIAINGAQFANGQEKLLLSEKELVKIEAAWKDGKIDLTSETFKFLKALSQQDIVIEKAIRMADEMAKRDDEARKMAEQEAKAQNDLADGIAETNEARRKSIEEIGLEGIELAKLKAKRIDLQISDLNDKRINKLNSGVDTSGIAQEIKDLEERRKLTVGSSIIRDVDAKIAELKALRAEKSYTAPAEVQGIDVDLAKLQKQRDALNGTEASKIIKEIDRQLAELRDQQAKALSATPDTSGIDRQIELLRQQRKIGYDETIKGIESENAAQERNIATLGLSEAALVATRNAALDYQIAILGSEAAIAKASGANDDYTASLDRLIAGLAKKKDLNSIELQTKKINEAAGQIGESFSRAFEDAVSGGKSLRETLQALEKDLLRIITRSLVTQPLGDAITGAIKGKIGGGGGLFDGLFGGSKTPSIGTSDGDGFKVSAGGGGIFDIFKNLLGFEKGGEPPIGIPSIVGERGPELFVPKSLGTIIPNGTFAAMTQQSQQPSMVFNIVGVKDEGGLRQSAAQVGAAASRAVSAGRRNL